MPPQSNETPQTIHDHSKLKPRKINFNKRAILFTVVGIVIVAIIAFVVLAAITANSTPDQKLYELKTKIVEPVIRATKLSADSKLEYTTDLLDKRVAELLTLSADQSTSSPKTLDRLASLTQQHTGDSVWLIKNTNSLSGEEKVTTLALITNSTRAFETLADSSEEFEPIKDYSSDIQNIAQDGLKSEIEYFISNTDAGAISAFIGEQIEIVGEEIKTVAQNSRAQQLALIRIDDAGEYITDAKFQEAIYALLRARQAIAVDHYLYAAERGEGNAEAANTEVIPEGS